MSILSFDKLSRAFGGTDVFLNLDGKIEMDSKIGLVGPNGIGKTTLLQLLAGVEETLTGEIYRANDLRIGYLRQEAVLAFADKENTLENEMMLVFEHVFEMERKMRSIEEGMADGSATDEDYDLYGDLQIKVELRGLYDYERRLERTLDGLGFEKEDWSKPINILSGGQKTRALLAKLVLEVPDLLILDEPTNHLDIEAIRWLEGILHIWQGALIVVSHDRYFLDRVVNRIWEMSPINIDAYKGNYSAYLRQRAEKRTRTQIEWDAMMERFWSELKFIQKHTLADLNAKGRFKRITREVEAIQSHGIDALRYIKRRSWSEYTNNFERKNPPATVKALEKAIKGLKSPIQNTKDMRVKLVAEERSGDMVLRGRKLSLGYERNNPLFTADDVDLERGDVAALIGPNGVGKSTVLKTILEKVPAIKGNFNFGVGVQVGYFAQAHDELDHSNTVLDELMRHKNIGIQASRKYLAPYLFQGDDVFKQVSDLSGGERGRLALAILGLEGANLLLLDEPTNHLDIPAQEVLQEVLESYNGTIILVTHDRYLVDRLATQIWDLHDGHMRVFKGTYQKYLTVVEEEKAADETLPKKKKKKQAPEPAAVDPKMIQHMETQIISLEGEIKELETLLAHASAAGNGDTITMLSKQYKAQQDKLHELNVEWEDLLTEA